MREHLKPINACIPPDPQTIIKTESPSILIYRLGVRTKASSLILGTQRLRTGIVGSVSIEWLWLYLSCPVIRNNHNSATEEEEESPPTRRIKTGKQRLTVQAGRNWRQCKHCPYPIVAGWEKRSERNGKKRGTTRGKRRSRADSMRHHHTVQFQQSRGSGVISVE